MKKHDKIVCVELGSVSAGGECPNGVAAPGRIYCVSSVSRSGNVRLVGLPVIDAGTGRDQGWPAHLFKPCGRSAIPARPAASTEVPPATLSRGGHQTVRRSLAIGLAAHLYRTMPSWFDGVTPEDCARELGIDAAEFREALASRLA